MAVLKVSSGKREESEEKKFSSQKRGDRTTKKERNTKGCLIRNGPPSRVVVVVAHDFDPSAWEAEAGASQWPAWLTQQVALGPRRDVFIKPFLSRLRDLRRPD